VFESQGQLKVTVYGAGEFVPAMGVFDAVSSGAVEMGHGGAYYWKGKVPAAQFFAGVPFGFTADEINAWVNRGGGLELWEDLYKPFNMKPLPGGNTGTQMFGWFNKEINSLEDIKGLKMRFPGFGGEVFRRAGGIPVNIPGGELYTAMQTGTIDAVEWVGPYNDLAFGFQQVAKYYYYPKARSLYGPTHSTASMVPVCMAVYNSPPGIFTGIPPALLKTSPPNPGKRIFNPLMSSRELISLLNQPNI
jgi:TRAP-type mannitol/chloroaromatic compound transport system substrate-binding protein